MHAIEFNLFTSKERDQPINTAAVTTNVVALPPKAVPAASSVAARPATPWAAQFQEKAPITFAETPGTSETP